MSELDIDKFYVSPYDKFLRGYDAHHEKTVSQVREIEKHRKIAQLRDHVLHQEQGKIWADF